MIIDYRAPGEAPEMGRNLFVQQDTKISTWGTYLPATFTNFTESGYSSEFDFTGGSGWENKYLQMDLQPNQQYTFAFDFTTPAYSQYLAGNGIRLELRNSISDISNVNSPNVLSTTSLPYVAGTTRQTFTFTTPATSTSLYICLNFGYVADATLVHFKFQNFKMEFGPTATAWTMAPEDSPNLILNSTFNQQMNNWSLTNPSFQSVLPPEDDKPRASIMHKKYDTYTGDSPEWNSLRTQVKADGTEQITVSLDLYAPSSAQVSQTVMTFRLADASTGGNITYFAGFGRGNLTGFVPNTWKRYSLTMTVPNNTTNKWLTTSIYSSDTTSANGNGPVDFKVRAIKVEMGATATDWTPAPGDTNTGADRVPIARAQHTIIDWNDSLSLTATISASQPLTQSYDSNAQTFTPDYSATNQVLTLGLFKANSTTDISGDGHLKSVTWYRRTEKDAEIDCSTDTSNWTVNGKTLTRKSNLSNNYTGMQVRVVAVYTDPVSGQDITVQAMTNMHIAVSGGGLMFAQVQLNGSPNLQDGKPTFVSSDTTYGDNLLRNSRYFTNTTYWSLAMDTTNQTTGAAVSGSMQLINDATYGNVVQGTYSGGTSWWYLSNNYYTYWKNKFVTGAQYTFTIMAKTTIPFSVGFLDGNGLNGVTSGWMSIPNNSSVWTEYSFTFTAQQAGNTPVMYIQRSGNTAGTIQVAYVKLEQGATKTSWSINQDDRPSVTEATAQGKWIWRRYQNKTNDGTRIIPTYSSFQGLMMNDERLVSDGATLFYSTLDNYYYGYLGTAVFVPQAGIVPITFDNDDTAAVYVNNQLVYSQQTTQTTTGANATTLNLIAGWNTIEFLYYEIAGNDGIWNFATSQVQLITNAATTLQSPSNILHTYPTLYNATLTADGWSRLPLGAGVTEILQNGVIAVQQGSTYTESFLYRTDSTDLTPKITFYSTTTGHHQVACTITDLGNGVKRAAATFTMDSTTLRLIDFYPTYTTGTYIDIMNPKLELGGTATQFSLAPADVAPSILLTHVQKVNAFFAAPFEQYLTNLTATCVFYRASIQDTTNVSYQWYKKDASAITDGSVELGVSYTPTVDDSNVGWIQLTGSTGETGYNTATLVIPGSCVTGREMYRCVVTDTLSSSTTYNQTFATQVTVSNTSSPLEVRVASSIGNTFLNGQGGTVLTAQVFRNNMELDLPGTAYTYTWYKYDKNGNQDTTWNSNQGFKSGKQLTVTSADVATKGTFSVQVQ